MAEARDRALFICKGRLIDSLGWLPLASTHGLAHGLSAPCFVDVCQNSDQPYPPMCVVVVVVNLTFNVATVMAMWQ